jgi:type II secretory pathway pseudopilin PulG
MHFKNKKKAFSLFELLIATGLLIFILSLAIFSFQKMSSAGRQKIFFNTLLQEIDQMRDLTRLDHRDRHIDFLNNHYELRTEGQAAVVKPYPQSLTLKSPLSFSFSNLGIPKKSGTAVFYHQSGKTIQVILTPVTGRIRLEEF